MSASASTVNSDAAVVVEIGSNSLAVDIPQTGDWGAFKTSELGQAEINEPGEQMLRVHAKDAGKWKAINLRFIKLSRGPGL